MTLNHADTTSCQVRILHPSAPENIMTYLFGETFFNCKFFLRCTVEKSLNKIHLNNCAIMLEKCTKNCMNSSLSTDWLSHRSCFILKLDVSQECCSWVK